MTKPEEEAREAIDKLLRVAGWEVCDAKYANVSVSRKIKHIHSDHMATIHPLK